MQEFLEDNAGFLVNPLFPNPFEEISKAIEKYSLIQILMKNLKKRKYRKKDTFNVKNSLGKFSEKAT